MIEVKHVFVISDSSDNRYQEQLEKARSVLFLGTSGQPIPGSVLTNNLWRRLGDHIHARQEQLSPLLLFAGLTKLLKRKRHMLFNLFLPIYMSKYTQMKIIYLNQ